MDWLSEDEDLFVNGPEVDGDFAELDEPTAELQFLEEAPTQLVQRVGEDRRSAPILDNFAKTALIAARSQQISLGDPIRLPKGSYSASAELSEIARLEMEKGVFPLKIIRTFADGTYEEWSVNEFTLIAE